MEQTADSGYSQDLPDNDENGQAANGQGPTSGDPTVGDPTYGSQGKDGNDQSEEPQERRYTFETAGDVYGRQKYPKKRRRDTTDKDEATDNGQPVEHREEIDYGSKPSPGGRKLRSAIYRHSTGSTYQLSAIYGNMKNGQAYCSTAANREYKDVIDRDRVQESNGVEGDQSIDESPPSRGRGQRSPGLANGSGALKKQPTPWLTKSIEQTNDEDDENQRLTNIVEREILDTSTVTVKWEDIAGLGRVKKIIREIVIWPMLRPDLFTGLKAPPRGLLLFGPPGTGKTTLGRCIASQANATFYCISASSLTSKWVGENEKLVRALFESARARQPAVVFVDEIDALLSNRTEGEHDSTRRLKTQFFTELDGAKNPGDERILVVGATNRPSDLDSAALRRLTKRLYVPLPDLNGRVEMFNNLLKMESHSLTPDAIGSIAEKTEGFSCDDLKKLCQEAALGPIRRLMTDIASVTSEEVPPISEEDFSSALGVVRCSVGPEQLAQYEEFDRRLGSTGGLG